MNDHIDHGLMAAIAHGVPARSPHWPAVERAFRAAHPHCMACPPNTPPHSVSVHHMWPFHIVVLLGRPDLELDSRNLISLCETTHELPAEDHHELIGHLADFQSYNVDVLQDAAVTFHGMINGAIRADARWLAKEHARPGAFSGMSDEQRKQIRVTLDSLFPSRAPLSDTVSE